MVDMNDEGRNVDSRTFAHLGPNELDTALALAVSIHQFNQAIKAAYEARDAAIRDAATKLALKDMCEVAGLSAERIRQITKEHPVRWKRHRTSGQ